MQKTPNAAGTVLRLSVQFVSQHNASPYLLLTFSDYTAIIHNKLMAVAGQAAQPMRSVGGDHQPPLPTPPTATTAP